MKEKWNELKEKWNALKETKGFRIFSTIVGLTSILGPSLFGFFSKDEPEPMSSLDEAAVILEDEERMDAIMTFGQRTITVNGSTVKIYLSADEDAAFSGATGLVIGVTQAEVLVATVYDAVKEQESAWVHFFEADCAEGRIVAVEKALNVAILAISKDSIPADIEDIIVPDTFSGNIKKGTMLYGYNKGAAEDSYAETVEVTDAKYEVALANGEEIKCIEVLLEEDAQILNRIFYTQDSQAVGMSVPEVVEGAKSGYVYIVPMDKILQIAGLTSER